MNPKADHPRYLIRLLAIAVVATLGSTVYGYAAHLTGATKTLGAAKTAPGTCSPTLWTLTPIYGGSQDTTVTGVNIAIASGATACTGDTLMVAANTSTTSSTGTGIAPAPGANVTVNLATSLTTTAVNNLSAVITGS